MEPTRDRKITLVDVLERVLEKGVVINADIIVTVAGVPLLGVNLRAALAGMETMLKYGMMKDWDEAIRAQSAPVPVAVATAAMATATATATAVETAMAVAVEKEGEKNS